MTTTKKLIVLGIIYTDNDFGVTGGRCGSLASEISDFYKRNSVGQLILQKNSAVVKVPFTATRANTGPATQYAIKKYPGYDYYAVVVHLIAASHAAGKVAHLIGFLYRDGQHEVGHLLHLEHSGAYDSKYNYNAYGDGLSVMGRFPSAYLAAPQYQFKDWIHSGSIAVYTGTNTQTFTIKRLVNFQEPGFAMVQIPKEGALTAYISYPQVTKYFGTTPYLTLHQQYSGGSKKIGSFTKEYYDSHFTQLHIVVVTADQNNITFTVDYNVPKSTYVQEPEEIQDTSVEYPESEPEESEELVK